MDTISQESLLLHRLAAAGAESKRTHVLLEALGMTVSSLCTELTTVHGWDRLEAAKAVSTALQQVQNELFAQALE